MPCLAALPPRLRLVSVSKYWNRSEFRVSLRQVKNRLSRQRRFRIYWASRTEGNRAAAAFLFGGDELGKLGGLTDGGEAGVVTSFSDDVAGFFVALKARSAEVERLAEVVQNFLILAERRF